MCNLLLPRHLGLSVDLCRSREFLSTIKEDGAHDDLGTSDGLVMIDVGSTVGAVAGLCEWIGVMQGEGLITSSGHLCLSCFSVKAEKEWRKGGLRKRKQRT